MNLIWCESTQRLQSSGIHKIPGALIMPMGMPIMPSWAIDHDVTHVQAKTFPKNLIWSESAQRLMSSGVGKIPRAFIMPMGMPIMPPWANAYDVAHVQPKTVPINLIWIEWVQRLLSYGIHKFGLDGWTDGWTDGWKNERMNKRTESIP